MPRDGSAFDLFSERENESLKSVSRVFQDVLTRQKERLFADVSSASALRSSESAL
jgi:hypothetical protein